MYKKKTPFLVRFQISQFPFAVQISYSIKKLQGLRLQPYTIIAMATISTTTIISIHDHNDGI